MSDPLYRKELLRLAADAHGAGRLENRDASGSAFNPACGDRVTVDIVFNGDQIAALALDTRACVLAQASASILGLALCGSTRADVETLRDAVRDMLTGDKSGPTAPFEAYSELKGAATYASRHRCVLLPIEAVLTALDSKRRDKDAVTG